MSVTSILYLVEPRRDVMTSTHPTLQCEYSILIAMQHAGKCQLKDTAHVSLQIFSQWSLLIGP